MFIPITHSIIYHYQIEKKNFLQCKSHRGSWSSRGFSWVLFSFHSNKFLFRFFSDRVLLSVLSDRDTILMVLNDGSLWVPSDRLFFGSSVIDSSLWSSLLFFQLVPLFFINTCYYFLFALYYQKELHTISSEKLKKYLHDKDMKYYIENICHQFPNL